MTLCSAAGLGGGGRALAPRAQLWELEKQRNGSSSDLDLWRKPSPAKAWSPASGNDVTLPGLFPHQEGASLHPGLNISLFCDLFSPFVSWLTELQSCLIGLASFLMCVCVTFRKVSGGR